MFYGGEYKSTAPYIQNAKNNVYAFIEGTDFPLARNSLQIVTSETENIFPVVKTRGIDVSVGVNSVFKGNSDGVGEKIDAALYADDNWVII